MRHLTRHLRPNATKVMIVYSKAQGVVRAIHDADHDREYDDHFALHEVHPGKGILYLLHAEYDALDGPALAELVGRHAGFGGAPEPHADRHAVVSPDGTVVAAIHCDPSCGDSGEHVAPGHTLIHHEHAEEGWRHVGGGVIEPPK